MTGPIPAGADYCRIAADEALREHLARNATNAIAQSHVIEAMQVVLDAYEDELYRSMDSDIGWVVMLGVQPMIVLPTKRLARHEMKLLKRMANGTGAWRIARTQRTYLPA